GWGGFLGRSAGATVRQAAPVLSGLAIIAVSLVLWFRPVRSEAAAIEEDAAREPGDLPLAIAGPAGNGYWGALVFLLIMATALTAFVASYFYLAEGPSSTWPPQGAPPAEMPLAATVLLLVTALLMWRVVKRVGAGRRAGPWIGVSLLLAAGFEFLSIRDFAASGLDPASSGYASAHLGVLGFQWVAVLVLAVMLLSALLWSWVRPDDPRGHATAHIAALTSWFAAASGVVTFATLYLTPRIW